MNWRIVWPKVGFIWPCWASSSGGKSTLLNALLGQDVLPTSVIPLTAIPTFIRHAASPGARVHYQDGRTPEEFSSERIKEVTAFLLKYVTESGNPKNRLGVSQVDVLHPAAILARGVVLIDTPGIGSTLRPTPRPRSISCRSATRRCSWFQLIRP
jgi:ribosome biogenesis GTPase A